MKDFNYYAPTEVVFGEQSEEQVARLVKKYGGTKVLVHYGGQSAVRSGLLDKVCGLLEENGIEYVKLGGVVPVSRWHRRASGFAVRKVLTSSSPWVAAVSLTRQNALPMVYATRATYGTSTWVSQRLQPCCH